MFLYSGSAAGGASHGGTGSGAPPARASKTTQISDKTTHKSDKTTQKSDETTQTTIASPKSDKSCYKLPQTSLTKKRKNCSVEQIIGEKIKGSLIFYLIFGNRLSPSI